jgi:rhodanese-related sulfurtransferase
MVAGNAMRGDSPAAHWSNVKEPGKFILDVREPSEFKAGHFESAVNIPLPTLRNTLHDLPKDKEILVYCGVGQRSYYATRILRLNGFQARSISGGMMTYKSLKNLS